MSVHITKTYNIGGLIGLRQNAVKNAGETLGFKEMSLFKFPDAYDSDDELHVRMDGIIASLCPEDIVIFQHPSGESPRYDGFLFEHLRRYHGTKIVAFIQEIASDRDDSEYSLSDEITLLNRAEFNCLHITAAFWCVRLYRDSAGRTGNACCLLRGRHHNIYH